MQNVKDTLRALVRISYDGRVHKTFRGPKAEERFNNEVRVLKHLKDRNCPFVPRLLEAHPDQLRIVTTTWAAAWSISTRSERRNFSRSCMRSACATTMPMRGM